MRIEKILDPQQISVRLAVTIHLAPTKKNKIKHMQRKRKLCENDYE